MQTTLAVISLGKIIKNLKAVSSETEVPLMAVVKDDAYGHGAERVSLELEPYVTGFAVSAIREGVALRTAGIGKEILVLTPPLSEEDALFSYWHGLCMTVSSRGTFRLLQRASETYGIPFRFQLKINTGMNRYGIRPKDTEAICRAAKESGAEITGVFSHLYAPEEKSARESQLKIFLSASACVKKYYPEAVRHLASTGGILAGKEFHFDLVRCGIALYGYLPSGFGGAIKVQPAMKVYATAVQSFSFTGGGVCYRRAERDYGTLSAIRLGYGDGFFRDGGIGNVNPLCMDASVFEGKAKAGKRKLILRDAEEYAKANGTIVYDALVRIGNKAERKYVR